MYKVINKVPHFRPYDIVRIKETGYLVIITEVNLNTSQDEDEHQWSYAVTAIEKGKPNKSAWYKATEFELVNNIFDIISRKSSHPFSDGSVGLGLVRRK